MLRRRISRRPSPAAPFGRSDPPISPPRRRIPLRCAPSRATGAFAAVRKGFGCRSHRSWRRFAGSEPFEAMLLTRERPITAHLDAGEGFVLATLATALDTAVLALAPGPRRGRGAARGRRVVPAGRGRSSCRRGRPCRTSCSRRRRRSRRGGQRRFAGCARQPAPRRRGAGRSRRCRRSRRPAGTVAPLELARGTTIAPDALAAALAGSGLSSASTWWSIAASSR